nr:PREDICTED: uncharacterized protein LOC109035096 [Bemisia tabaci]
MLTSFSKIYEHVITARLYEKVKLSEKQFGFLKGRSTISALYRLRQAYERIKNIPKRVRGILLGVGLDISNAFNSLRWDDITLSLETQAVPEYLIKLLESYFKERSVSYRGHTFRINSGIGQGSILGPLIFNIVFDNIVRMKVDPELEKIVYADDTLLLIYVRNEDEIKEATSKVTRRYRKKLKEKGLKLAADKSEAIVLVGNGVSSDVEVMVDTEVIHAGTPFRHLGFYIDRGFDMSRHVHIVCDKMRRVGHSFRPIMPNTADPSFFRRILIVQAVLSILFYGVTVWCSAMQKKGNIKKITSTLRPLKRMLVGGYVSCSNFSLDILSGIPPTKILVEERVRKANKMDPEKINRYKRRDWLAAWREDTGNAWFKRILGDLGIWLDRGHGCCDFYLCQFLAVLDG